MQGSVQSRKDGGRGPFLALYRAFFFPSLTLPLYLHPHYFMTPSSVSVWDMDNDSHMQYFWLKAATMYELASFLLDITT